MQGDVPRGWQSSSLGKLGKWTGGGTPSKTRADYWLDGHIPWVSPKDMKTSKIDRTEDYITETAVKESSTHVVPEDSVLIVTRSGILRHSFPVARAGCPVAINQDIKALVPNDSVDAGFSFALLEGNGKAILQDCTKVGTTVESVDFSALSVFPILLPPLPEQKKIAVILSSVDEAIQATQRVIDQTRRVKEGLLQDLLTRGMPGHTRFKQTEIGEIPESWEVRSIGELLVSCTYGVSCSLSTDRVGTPVLRMGNLQEDEIDLSDLKYADLSSFEQEAVLLEPDDIVFNRTNSWDLVGKVAMVPDDVGDLAYASYLLRLRVDRSRAVSRWLWLVMSSRSFQDTIRSIATKGVSQANVNPTRMRSLLIGVPPIKEQHAINEISQQLSKQNNANKAALLNLRNLKTGLLQDLLTGKVRVSP